MIAVTALPTAASAQITPDGTLGNEGSTVTEGAIVRGDLADLIEGGAIRGGNLFHSFLEFNVDLGQRIYFANPAGIESILSRITGGDPSNLFGTLGVDGTADLFLINPNGIVFGENASLDIQGSFYASTAEAIPLGDGVYSATAPEQSSLLTVNPSALVSSYLSNGSGNIEYWGQLLAGENLTLAANRLDLQGQVAAGGDLTLLGNTVQIRDAVDTPFVGFAGGDLLVQGNERVDIVALSHSESGLYSYGDMALRSANPIGGDAHYWSGGDFRIENLNGEGGNLYSPIDPVIRAFGDVEIEGYQGSSLHILAGGSVYIGTAIITAPDPGTIEVDFLQETIILSDGTVVDIDGGAQPTLDIRAGVDPEVISFEGVTGPDQNIDSAFGLDFLPSPSSANIRVGDVLMAAPNGLVLLTNQYAPNRELSTGNILINGEGVYGNGINAENPAGQGGTVYLDARNDISVVNSFISTTSLGIVGDVVINAGDTARFDAMDGSLTGAFSTLAIGEEGRGGNVRLSTRTLEVLNGARLSASTAGIGNAGNVILKIRETARFDGVNPLTGLSSSGAFSNVELDGEGQGGNIELSAANLEVTNGAQIGTLTFGIGDAGNVILTVNETARFDGLSLLNQIPSAVGSNVRANAIGNGGNLYIHATWLEVINSALISTSTFGNGNAGSASVEIIETAQFDGANSKIQSSVGNSANGIGGNISISANILKVTNGAEVNAATFGNGSAGNIVLEISETAYLDGDSAVGSSVESNAFGNAGTVHLNSTNLQVFNGSQILTSTFGQGDAGDVIINVAETANFNGVDFISGSPSAVASSVELEGRGKGGNVEITATNLLVNNGANLIAATFGIGNAGNVNLNIREAARFDGVSPGDGSNPSGAGTIVGRNAVGNGGNIRLRANTLEIVDGATITSGSRGSGNAGNVFLNVTDQIRVDNGIIATTALVASGGNIDIHSSNLILRGDSDILTTVGSGAGSGGNIAIFADFIIALGDSDILAFSADGRGGAIDLSRTNFFGQNANIGSSNQTREELLALDGNARVDINATGGVESGQIFIGDSNFITNSLTSLTDTIIDPSTLTAGSCIARTDDSLGSFAVTGSGGLSQRPVDSSISSYPTGTVRTTATLQEPDGVYQLPDGRLVLSRTCD